MSSEETRDDSPEFLKHRLEKLDTLRRSGINPYPYRFERSHTSKQIKDDFELLSASTAKIRFAGRITSIRGHGKTLFANISDGSGKMQIYARQDDLGDKWGFFELIDIGDFIGVEGAVFRTKMGEITIRVEKAEMLAKSLRPLPEKWHGLQDKELRYRRRYLDLIANPEVMELFAKRAQIIREVRKFLDERGFIEVETPVLQPIYGGAAARPFVTHHNALDMDLYLRIADELYLKRLIIGGFEKVYEIAKDFRNEGMDKHHNPEFTMVEFYWAYADYTDMMVLLEDMFRTLVNSVAGSSQVPFGEQLIDLGQPFKRLPYFKEITEACGHNLIDLSAIELESLAKTLGLEVKPNLSRGEYFEAFFEHYVEPHLIQPTFLMDFPIEISPLAKVHRSDPRLAERFELFIAGFEFGNAFSELNDPQDQRRRMQEQAALKERGHAEAAPMDEDFIFALEHGMPPTAGYGLGIDRLVMLLANAPSIRDIIIFPTMKPEG